MPATAPPATAAPAVPAAPAAPAVDTAAAATAAQALLAAKKKTDHTIALEVTVDGTPADVYKMWTTSDGVKAFMAPLATIDPFVGGRYQIGFDPENDPEGKTYGTYGCKILRLDPPHFASFEWTFPPLGAELNTQPFPTWVEVQFDAVPAVPGQPARTVVHLHHYGFPQSPNWDKGFAMFRDKNWPFVLASLKEYCHKQALRPAQ